MFDNGANAPALPTRTVEDLPPDPLYDRAVEAVEKLAEGYERRKSDSDT